MNIDGEQDLRQRLGQALGAVTAGPAPVDRAVRQGRTIRIRRRLAAVAATAVVAAAAVAVPVLLHQEGAHNAVTPRPRHHTVTVHRPGPHAPAGLVAWGTIDGRHWGISLGKPGTGPAGRGSQCVRVLGSLNCGPALGANHGPDPVAFASSGGDARTATYAYGAVAPDVAYLTLRLTGGTVLTLHPVRVWGVRVAGFEAPLADVVSLTAYPRHGVPVTTIPLHGPDSQLYYGAWLRPGQRGLPRVTQLIASGRVAGAAWRAIVYQGPWGLCLFGGNGADCGLPPSQPGTGIYGSRSLTPQVIWGHAAPDVAHVVIFLPDGRKIRVRAVLAGRQKYFAFAVPGNRPQPFRWMAYDSARHPVGSGRA